MAAPRALCFAPLNTCVCHYTCKSHYLYCVVLGQRNVTFNMYKTLSDLLHDVSNSIPHPIFLYGYTPQELEPLPYPHLLRSILGKSLELRTGQEYCIIWPLVQIDPSINRNSLPIGEGQVEITDAVVRELLPCKVYSDFHRLIVHVSPRNESRVKIRHLSVCSPLE